MYGLQSLARDTHQLIALELAQAPSKATAYVPSVRSWGSTNRYFRALLLDAGWLAPADVCKAKLSQVARFSCPALRVLDVAEHFAPELPLKAFTDTLTTLPKTVACPDHSALPMMLVSRAGSRLERETKAALMEAVAASRYALPVDAGERGWAFTVAERNALRRFIADCFGVTSIGDLSVVLAIGHRHFAEDFMEVMQQLPVGLRALALHELTFCLEELTVVCVDGTADARMDVLFEIDQLIPVQWHAALADLSIFANRSFDRCLQMLMSNFGRRVAVDAGKRVLTLLSDFFCHLPKASRHWSKLDAVCAADELRLLKELVLQMRDNPHLRGLRSSTQKVLVRNGFTRRSEVNSKQAIEAFQAWCLSGNDIDQRMGAFARELAHRSAYS